MLAEYSYTNNEFIEEKGIAETGDTDSLKQYLREIGRYELLSEDETKTLFKRIEAGDKAAHDVVGIVLVSKDVLPAQQHLQLGVGHLGADLSQTFPRILVQVAQAHIEGGSAPTFHRVKPCLVHRLQYGLELVIAQPCRHKGLVCIAQYGLCKLYFHGSS